MSGPPLPFADRADAGRALGAEVRKRLPGVDLVLGLPRGGVPVAAEVARALGAPLDVFVVRKLGAPGQPELALGAIAGGGVRVLNEDLVRRLRVDPAALERVAAREATELARREEAFRGNRPSPSLRGRSVALVDDGLATGATVLAAVAATRAAGAGRVAVAVPVGAPEACARVEAAADDLVCLAAPPGFGAVGRYYVDFEQTTDEQVQALLAEAAPGP